MSLQATQLIGFGVRRTAALPSISYVSNANVATNNVQHTFPGQSIGATGNNRYIAVCISGYQGTIGALSSATIGGISATIAVQANGTTTVTAIIIAAVPTGTTADIVLNWAVNTQLLGISVYRIVDLNSGTANTTGTDTVLSAGVASLTLNNNANAVMIASACSIDGTAWGSWTSGLTEDSDQYVGSSTAAASASGFFATANTPYTASASAGTGTRGAMVVATWNN